jgi:hypothetical protein
MQWNRSTIIHTRCYTFGSVVAVGSRHVAACVGMLLVVPIEPTTTTPAFWSVAIRVSSDELRWRVGRKRGAR